MKEYWCEKCGKIHSGRKCPPRSYIKRKKQGKKQSLEDLVMQKIIYYKKVLKRNPVERNPLAYTFCQVILGELEEILQKITDAKP